MRREFEVFWNTAWSENALFCRAERNPSVPKEVIVGTVNRVAHGCSNIPKFASPTRCRANVLMSPQTAPFQITAPFKMTISENRLQSTADSPISSVPCPLPPCPQHPIVRLW